MTEEKSVEQFSDRPKKGTFLGLNGNAEERKSSLPYFLSALILVIAVYLSELFYLIEEPLFGWIYYGNITHLLAQGLACIYMIAVIIVFHKLFKHYLKDTPFFHKRKQKVRPLRRLALYLMTLLPVLITAMVLGFKFKLVVNLGEQITLFTLLENVGTLVVASIKILSAIYCIFLIERGCRKLFDANKFIPFGGIFCMIFYGVIEFLVAGGAFAVLNLILYLYFGVVYIVSEGRFAVTYLIAVLLFVL